MAQPVKKKIQEVHSDLIKEKPFYTLLVDGNSLLFMCFKDSTVNSDGVHVGGIYQFLLQLRMLMDKINPDYVYVTFDNEYSGWLRWQLYKPYKANRDKHYSDYGISDYMKEYNKKLHAMQDYLFSKNKETHKPDKKSEWDTLIDDNFDRERNTLMKYFEEMYIRTLFDDVTEGDDFIAYYCKHKKENERIYIVSGDMDLSQLLGENIAIYNLKLKKYITKDNFKSYFGYHYANTLVKKVFCGDVSDNIGNIKGLSEDGFKKLMPEYIDKPITIDDVKNRAKSLIEERKANKKKPLQVHENILNGISNKVYDGDFYDVNKRIIDLKEPIMSKEALELMDAVSYAPIDPDGRSFKNLYRCIVEDGIEELSGDTKFASFFSPFKRLEEKEVNRYNESVKK